MDIPNMQLSAPEIANLWTQYMRETMAICITKFALRHMQDQDIRSIYEHSLGISENHINQITEKFKQFQIPIPMGFNDKDVNYEAHALF